MNKTASNEVIPTNRDNHLWLQLWRDRQTDFHQKKINKHLTTFWPRLKLKRGSRVFVPLCGKSLDMTWLANQGCEVIGVELSPVAIKAFFKENRLKPVKRRIGKHNVWKHGRISILCGDFFSLDASDLGHIDTVYDRAALTALPPDIRQRYATHLQRITPQADIFLLTVEDIECAIDQISEPSIDEEITTLFSQQYDITLTHTDIDNSNNPDLQKMALMQTEHKVYKISMKPM